jgi:hypothetical protein
MDDEQATRIAWFHAYTTRTEQGTVKPPAEGIRYPCPCCGYPTLTERGGYDICPLCGWEDDGQDDPHAEEVWGGPNGSYSLAAARRNFKLHLIKSDPTKPSTRIGGHDSPRELEAKRRMMAAFDAMPAANGDELENLWREVNEANAVLESETERKIREYERQHAEREST